MNANLDTLCTYVFCITDDFLPTARANAKRSVTDAEIVTLCVAQTAMGIVSDRRFLAVARKRLRHLIPVLPNQAGFHKRKARLADQIERLIGVFASRSPGFEDDLLLIDSTPLECGRSVETARRSALGDAADYGWCASHSRRFWGFRLHCLFAPDGTPRALALASPKRGEREVGLTLIERAARGGETVVGDKGYAGKEFEGVAGDLGVAFVRPSRADEPDNGVHLAPIRQRIESIFWTCKDFLTLERHGARTLHNLRTRIAQRFMTLAACVSLNHMLGRPSRAMVDYVA